MNYQEFQILLDAIENSKDQARWKMNEAKDESEKEYYCGNIGGLQIAKQHLERLQNREAWK